MAQIYAGAGINTAWDLIVFFLPIPRLMKVQISTRKKIGICIVSHKSCIDQIEANNEQTFLVGLFVTICSVVRLVYIIHWSATTNPTWTYSPIALWSLVECDIGIVCACMPALAGPIKRFWIATVGKPLSNLYNSHVKTQTNSSKYEHSTSGNHGWRNISRPGADSKPGDNTIMCNTSLNVSDEMELVDKDPNSRKYHDGSTDAHNYRQKW
jgi:hypothetical protein